MGRRPQSFVTQLMVVFLTIGGLAFSLSAIPGILHTQDQLRVSIANLQLLSAERAADRIKGYVDLHVVKVQEVAHTQSLLLTADERQMCVTETLLEDEDLLYVGYFNAAGHVVAEDYRGGAGYSGRGEVGDRAAARRAVAAGRDYLGAPRVGPGGRLVMTLAAPVRGRDGAVVGMVQAEQSLARMWDALETIRVGSEGNVYVVDSKGYLIAGSDQALVRRRPNLMNREPVEEVVDERVPCDGQSADDEYTDENGVRMYAAGVPILKLNWGVIAEQPISEAMHPVSLLWRYAGLVALVALLMAFLASQILSRRLAGPLRALKEGAQRVGEGDLDLEIVPGGSSEVESVAESFNAMTAALKARLNEVRVQGEAVEREKAKLEQLLEHSSDGIIIIDGLGTVLRWNAAMSELSGFPADSVRWPSLAELLQEGADAAGGSAPGEALPELLERIRRGEAVEPRELKLRPRSGVEKWAELSFAVLPEASADEATAIITVRDVTKARQIAQLKDELLEVASHELRTPMTAIKGYLSMILDGDLGEIGDDVREYLNEAFKGNNRLIKVVEDMLRVSHMESDEYQLELGPVEIPDLVAEVVGSCGDDAALKGLSLEVSDMPSNLPQVQANPEALREILDNLLKNAIKFTREGRITVRARPSVGGVTVEVVDTGPGIAVADQDRLFQKFGRLGSVLTEHVGGTGMGLYVCRRLVELMGGRIWFESEEGRGTTFAFEISSWEKGGGGLQAGNPTEEGAAAATAAVADEAPKPGEEAC